MHAVTPGRLDRARGQRRVDVEQAGANGSLVPRSTCCHHGEIMSSEPSLRKKRVHVFMRAILRRRRHRTAPITWNGLTSFFQPQTLQMTCILDGPLWHLYCSIVLCCHIKHVILGASLGNRNESYGSYRGCCRNGRGLYREREDRAGRGQGGTAWRAPRLVAQSSHST